MHQKQTAGSDTHFVISVLSIQPQQSIQMDQSYKFYTVFHMLKKFYWKLCFKVKRIWIIPKQLLPSLEEEMMDEQLFFNHYFK